MVKPYNIITTENPSGVTLTGATLNGSLSNSNYAPMDCYFQYGTSTLYTSSTWGPPGFTSLYDNGNFSYTISGLTEGVTYHFRAAAYNWETYSYVYGEDKTFTPRHNIVITNDATLVFNTGATLNGAISNFEANQAACYFQYGTTPSYGSSTDVTPGLQVFLRMVPFRRYFRFDTRSYLSLQSGSLSIWTKYHCLWI